MSHILSFRCFNYLFVFTIENSVYKYVTRNNKELKTWFKFFSEEISAKVDWVDKV